ncbi:MAG: YjeF N-terminal domain-containing protein [Benjaminiella poitrasii]|nr:MAG: YjeF N-terminal domain-containing protein [Benjaminiella poitrasii]
MDKYIGVYVKLVLDKGDKVKGSISGKDEQGHLLLKDAIIEHCNGYNSKETLLPIITTSIKDLEVLQMNTPSQAQQSQPTSQQTPQSVPPQMPRPLSQQMPQQMPLQQQQSMFYQQPMQQQKKQQPTQHQYMMQHSMQQSMSQPLHQQQQQQPLQHFLQQNHIPNQMPPTTATSASTKTNSALHLDPAILFHQQSPNLSRDPAIISTQQPPYETQPKKPLTNHAKPLDPAILFSSSSSQLRPTKSLNPSILFQQQSQQQSQPQQLQGQTQGQTQGQQKQPQQQRQPRQQKKQAFQDPAIISLTSASSSQSKKPLFNTRKVNKAAKEVVVFEDYSDFENGKPSMKKTEQASKKQQQEPLQKQAPITNAAKTTVPTATTTIARTIISTQPPTTSNSTAATTSVTNIPAVLIPPRVRRNGSSSNSNIIAQKMRILTVAGGLEVPTVNANQMETAKLIGREVGLNQTQWIENGAFGASAMVLKAIGGHRRIQPDNHNAAPVVVILVGPTTIGETGIAAARHLANRGCNVIVSVSEDSYCGAMVQQYKSLAKFSGARVVSSLDELPDPYTMPVDIIVDALLGPDMLKITPAIRAQMDWANSNKAPVLSIEFPSGVNPNDGSLPSEEPEAYIRPKWTLCLAAPYTGCTSRNITGELFLADTGLPFTCFEQSVTGPFHIPWGSDFVLALEYAS